MKKRMILSTLPLISILLVVSWCSCQVQEIDTIDGDVEIATSTYSYTIVGTGQKTFYNNYSEISEPEQGDDFYGQDACYAQNAPDYVDNQDGTITDKVTGLMWQQDPGEKMTYDEAISLLSSIELAGYTDWRMPTIKELYSLIQFNGTDPSGYESSFTDGLQPFIDDNYFVFSYGREEDGDRLIDSQFATSTFDVGGSAFGGGNLMFGVNFADGRIKGYPTGAMPGRSAKTFYVLFVRGNTDYGINQLKDNKDGTISDEATGLMWMKNDNGVAVDWEDALTYAEGLVYADHSDWRLPTTKELQSIVDYSRAPDATQSAAIDEMFTCTSIVNEGGDDDFGYYWSSTTHYNFLNEASNAVYVSFGRGLGYFNGVWMDVHGAGCQRSDPKEGSADFYPFGHGPQGDAIRIKNYVRCVRSIE
ncbi:DUF1566 domain-containing protein [Carboxylicivirga caseinilyticus]|uniref:Lcl C-terminal domain-containing protein n=1 Tax=Carboxylicivirga caseinilyticus TaxID=3417572 RepID=UPI003D327BCF|nr:DUF1566 domain-containing protein [Marinilabiliaceae bacterium A049]